MFDSNIFDCESMESLISLDYRYNYTCKLRGKILILRSMQYHVDMYYAVLSVRAYCFIVSVVVVHGIESCIHQ